MCLFDYAAQSFQLSEEDQHLLLFFNTAAIVKKHWQMEVGAVVGVLVAVVVVHVNVIWAVYWRI